MPLNLNAKKEIVKQVQDIAGASSSVVVVNYRGLTVSEINQLRSKARALGAINVLVVRNTLIIRGVQDTPFSCIKDACVGPSLFVFSQEDPGAGARLCKDFGKNRDKFVVKALSVGGRLYTAQDLDTVARLPTREQALSMLLSVMKAPIAQLARTLAEPAAKLVRTIAAVGEQKKG